MALNLDAMKAKLDKLNGKGDTGKKNFWRPGETLEMTVQHVILQTSSGTKVRKRVSDKQKKCLQSKDFSPQS